MWNNHTNQAVDATSGITQFESMHGAESEINGSGTEYLSPTEKRWEHLTRMQFVNELPPDLAPKEVELSNSIVEAIRFCQQAIAPISSTPEGVVVSQVATAAVQATFKLKTVLQGNIQLSRFFLIFSGLARPYFVFAGSIDKICMIIQTLLEKLKVAIATAIPIRTPQDKNTLNLCHGAYGPSFAHRKFS